MRSLMGWVRSSRAAWCTFTGALFLVLALGSGLGTLALSSLGGGATTFSPGETVQVPGVSGLPTPLVVYGDPATVAAGDANNDVDLGCVVTGPDGPEAVDGFPLRVADVQIAGTTYAPVAELDARYGGSLVCTGPRAGEFAPLAFGRSEAPAPALVVGVALTVVAAIAGTVLLVTGVRGLRRR